jgi:hypothetical protein
MVVTCAPSPAPTSRSCVVDLKPECEFVLGPVQVVLDARSLSVKRDNQVTWSEGLAGDDEFKEVSAVNTPGGLRLAYSVLHCPTQCLSADIVVIDDADQSAAREVFRSTQFGVGARILTSIDGQTLEVTQQVFQPGDMCCPSGNSTTHFTWNGATYVATP